MLTESELKSLHSQFNEFWKEEQQKKRKQQKVFNTTLPCIRFLFVVKKVKDYWPTNLRKGKSPFRITKNAQRRRPKILP